MLSAVVVLTILLLQGVFAQTVSTKYPDGVTIHGTVRGSDGKAVSEAVVSLRRKNSSSGVETKTNTVGAYAFSSLSLGSYQISAEKSGLRSASTLVVASSEKSIEKIDLILQKLEQASNSEVSAAPSAQVMEFADKPSFTVAGVTDWTAVGGHGSDSTLRTSESLASDTVTLKPEDTGHTQAKISGSVSKESEAKLRAALANSSSSFNANYQLGKFYLSTERYGEAIPLLESASRINPADNANRYDLALAYEGADGPSQARARIRELLANRQDGDLHRLMGELDEKLGDPLSAVHEYEQAVKLSPSEQNYFEWGSELLLHRAVWQAQEVFRKGVGAYPKSVRMQTALSTALFAGARYDEAALHLCTASDMNPNDTNAYIFMGKIQIAAPNFLACVGPKLARFVHQQPESSVANYLYAMSILKRQERQPDKQAIQQAEVLLKKAVTLDSKCSEGYLQLGILSASQRDLDGAIAMYKSAIEADPQLADAHYRLAVAYDRTGQPSKAKQELQLHDQIMQQQAAAAERQRREVKQFLIVQPGEPFGSTAK